MKLRVNKNRVEWEDGHLQFNLPVLDAIQVGARILVIHDYMSYPGGKAAGNLVAYSTNGEQLWVAENLNECAGTDAYVKFMSEEPLVVWNFACCRCAIDLNTGKLIDSQFLK